MDLIEFGGEAENIANEGTVVHTRFGCVLIFFVGFGNWAAVLHGAGLQPASWRIAVLSEKWATAITPAQ